MTNPLLLTEEQEQELVSITKNWLGYSGILHLKDIKETVGALDTVWMELQEVDYIPQYIPRSILKEEARNFKSFLDTIDICKGWSNEDFKAHWVWLLEESIKEVE